MSIQDLKSNSNSISLHNIQFALEILQTPDERSKLLDALNSQMQECQEEQLDCLICGLGRYNEQHLLGLSL